MAPPEVGRPQIWGLSWRVRFCLWQKQKNAITKTRFTPEAGREASGKSMVRSREGVFSFPSLISGGPAHLLQKFPSQAAPPEGFLPTDPHPLLSKADPFLLGWVWTVSQWCQIKSPQDLASNRVILFWNRKSNQDNSKKQTIQRSVSLKTKLQECSKNISK